MKKLSLLLMVVFVASMSFGQNMMVKKDRSFPVKSDKQEQTKDLEVIWENDFSNAAEWVTEYLPDNPNDGPWVIGTAGPAGFYSAGMGAINSTTAANGFAMYDSDGIGVSETTQDSKLTYTGSINCTGYTNVGVQFESYYRKYHGTPYLEVSVNGGTTWTQFEVHSDLTVNQASANPSIQIVNISAVAANQPEVKIRFRYVGEWDYAWMVDDVQVFVAPDYDVSIVDVRINFFPQYINYGFSGFYGQIPSFQMYEVGAPITFTGVVKNFGTQTVTPNFNAIVKDNTGSEVYAITATYEGTLATEELDTINTDEPYFFFDPASDQEYGIYTFELSTDVDGATDENPANNMVTYQTYLNPSMYAHDNDTYSGQWSTCNYNGGCLDGDVIGVTYPIFVSCDINYVDVFIGSMTEVGASFLVKLMTRADVGEPFEELVSSALITIEDESMVGTMHTIEFADPYTVELAADEWMELFVAVEYYTGGDTYHFRLGIDASVPTSGWETWMYFSGEDTWYYYGGTHVPIIRLSVGPYSGNTTIVSEDISVYPNPANDIVNLNNVEGANIQVVDITGKVLVNMNAAQNSVAVDMSAFAQGTYIIRILNENGLTVKKVNLVK